jgi:hypothetical protein
MNIILSTQWFRIYYVDLVMTSQHHHLNHNHQLHTSCLISALSSVKSSLVKYLIWVIPYQTNAPTCSRVRVHTHIHFRGKIFMTTPLTNQILQACWVSFKSDNVGNFTFLYPVIAEIKHF